MLSQEVVDSAAPVASRLQKTTLRQAQPAAREVHRECSSMAALPEERANGTL